MARPKKETLGKSYIFEFDDQKFRVRYSDNAWWKDALKVEKLFTAFSVGAKIKEALNHAGITYDQYTYFMKEHPAFAILKETAEVSFEMQARISVYKGIKKNPELGLRILERKVPEEFGPPKQDFGFKGQLEHVITKIQILPPTDSKQPQLNGSTARKAPTTRKDSSNRAV